MQPALKGPCDSKQSVSTGASFQCALTAELAAQSLLGEPNNDSPLNTHAAKLWANADEYRRVLHKKYAEAAAK